MENNDFTFENYDFRNEFQKKDSWEEESTIDFSNIENIDAESITNSKILEQIRNLSDFENNDVVIQHQFDTLVPFLNENELKETAEKYIVSNDKSNILPEKDIENLEKDMNFSINKEENIFITQDIEINDNLLNMMDKKLYQENYNALKYLQFGDFTLNSKQENHPKRKIGLKRMSGEEYIISDNKENIFKKSIQK